ncbi:MAG: shikimate dehydrogenase [Bacteroidetes bacterium HGW-Bacteroidetes-12]|nr:MAG: shikimate dehydrogenase [Bacteroidetes bacterium HGW-Bacteroidetes-12]
MNQYGLIGKKLSHSFSKNYFEEKFRRENISAVYENYELNEINQVVELLSPQTNLRGLNVTIPYKVTIIPFLDELDETAKKIGAVNTIKIDPVTKKTKGYNTDVYGFKQSIKPFLENQHQRALILGTGGASKAVNFVLNELGIPTLFVSRNPTKENEISYHEVDSNLMKSYFLIVNTTPLGMFPAINDKPLLNYDELTSQHLLYDLIYHPTETLFLKEGKIRNAQTVNGLSMLKLQAEKAWEIW